ncbi:hypothetical protein U5B43_02905, partial [Campylobacter sp. 9BO]|uniref:hypothetical protein n=1 Tax=Campylobacter sp. 9BO TaxID=3424759 RepID=UPI003D345EAA
MFINFKALMISCFAVIALLGFCAWQDIKIKNIKAELKAATLENLAIQANLNECVARVDLQN